VADSQILQVECPRGTDFSVQLFWTGVDGEGIDFVGPARADVRDTAGTLVLRFVDSSENPDANADGVLKRSSSSSVVQLTAKKELTRLLPVGRYWFDVLVTVAPSTDFPGGQLAPVVGGWFVVTPVQTDMEA
jgi:hypothetical protein